MTMDFILQTLRRAGEAERRKEARYRKPGNDEPSLMRYHRDRAEAFEKAHDVLANLPPASAA